MESSNPRRDPIRLQASRHAAQYAAEREQMAMEAGVHQEFLEAERGRASQRRQLKEILAQECSGHLARESASAPPAEKVARRSVQGARQAANAQGVYNGLGVHVHGGDDEDDAETQRKALREAVLATDHRKIKALNGPYETAEGTVYYARCKSDANCPFRYRAVFKGNQIAVAGKGEHSAEPAIARSDAAIPVTQEAVAAVKAAVERVGAQRAVPEDIQESMEGTPAEFMPGKAVQNIVKRMRRKLYKWGGPRRYNLEVVEEFCLPREIQIDAPEVTLPKDTSSMIVVRLGQRPDQRLPVADGKNLVMAFTAWRFVEQTVTVAGEFLTQGLIGQADFLFKVVWHGYALGVLGCQVYHKVGGCWKKHFLPLLFILGLAEDTSHYGLLYEAAQLLLQLECLRQKLPCPQRWFRQMHTDHTAASIAAGEAVLPGTTLVHDLEHLFRNLRRHQCEDARLPAQHVSLLVSNVAFSAFLPTASAFHLFWQTAFVQMGREWKAATFVKYFRSTYFKERGGRIWARWWSGRWSSLAAGFAASQNLIEAFNATLRRMVKKVGHHQGLVQLLERLESKFKVWTKTPGAVFGICGPKTTQQMPPLPIESLSRDLIEGPGRQAKLGGRRVHWPTVRHIVDAHRATGGRAVLETPAQEGKHQLFIMHREWQSSPSPVSEQDAQTLLRIHSQRTVEGVEAEWRRAGIVHKDENGHDKIVWRTILHFYRRLVVVRQAADDSICCWCELFCKESACPHVAAVLELKGKPEGKASLLGTGLPLGRSGRGGRPPARSGKTSAYETQEQALTCGDADAVALKRKRPTVEDRLDEALAPFARKVDRRTPRDGHCLFHALALGGLLDDLGPDSLTIRQIRALALSIATEEQLAAAAASDKVSVPDYKRRMLSMEYGDNVMFALLARCFVRDVTTSKRGTSIAKPAASPPSSSKAGVTTSKCGTSIAEPAAKRLTVSPIEARPADTVSRPSPVEGNAHRLLAWLRRYAADHKRQVFTVSEVLEELPLACAGGALNWRLAKQAYRDALLKLERDKSIAIVKAKRQLETWQLDLRSSSARGS